MTGVAAGYEPAHVAGQFVLHPLKRGSCSEPDIRDPVTVMAPQTDVTALLQRHRAGDSEALEILFSVVYQHLRRIAHAQLNREAEGHTLCTTALVHEAYVKLVDAAQIDWQDRQHLLALASRAMRQILIDYARRNRTAKRGGNPGRVDLDEVQIAVVERAETLILLDEALSRLSEFSPRLGQVVEYRFFGGLTEQETAETMGVTDRTVRRDWIKARGWLNQEMTKAALG